MYKRQAQPCAEGTDEVGIDIADRIVVSTFDQIGRAGRNAVSYTHLRAHETVLDLVCRLLLEKQKNKKTNSSADHSHKP